MAAERVLPARWPNQRRCAAGGLLATCAVAALAIPGPAAVTVVSLALLGAGLGAYIPANNAEIMAAVPARDAATAGGMVNMTRGLGTALGVAVVTLGLHAGAHLGHADGGRLAIAALTAAALAATWAGTRSATAAPRRRRRHQAGRSPVNQTTAANSVSARGGAARPDGLAEGIARLRRALRRGARVADPGNPLAVAQLELLSALTEHPGARPGQLARLLHMRPNTVTTIVNNLTAQGMVSRATADGDRRAVELTATEAGQQAVHAWQATNAAVLHLALSTLPAPQRRALAAAVPALAALASAVDRLADSPPEPPARAGHTMTRNPARVPPPSRPVPPTQSWYATAGAAALAALTLLALHTNRLITAAGLLAAGAAATALAEARLRSRPGTPRATPRQRGLASAGAPAAPPDRFCRPGGSKAT